MMNNMKRSIKRFFWLIVFMFFLAICYLIKLSVFDRQAISVNPYNPRLTYSDPSIKRGDIKDLDGNIIAESAFTDDGYVRSYPRKRMPAHITGYSSRGKTGIEAAENFELETVSNEILQRLQSVVTGSEVEGNSVVLTVDMEIQSLAGDLLGNQKGAIVVMEATTGRILAMQAYPDYDPNTVAENWESLSSDPDSPLLNRAAQGLYPPGSTYKVVTALAAMRNLGDWNSFTYECRGEAEIGGRVIHCYNNTVHGTVDINSAMAQSCNCYFAELGRKIGAEKLAETSESVYFNKSLNFVMPSQNSTVSIKAGAEDSELVETAIGQGRTLATPLYMACLASAIANGGTLRTPYIVDHIEYPNGKETKITLPVSLESIMTAEEASALREMMLGVVNHGTGRAAGLANYDTAGKTGTAENSGGSDHSWFIGFAPYDEPRIAVAVLLENAEGGRRATPIAGRLMEAALNKYE